MTTIPERPKPEAAGAPINQLLELSHFYGSNLEFVIAGGGNTSVKAEDTLFVKGSGVSLATLDAGGLVEMDRDSLTELLKRDLGEEPVKREEMFKQAILAARRHPELGQRPSVECVLHNLLPRRFVVHSHQTQVNMLSCCAMGEALAGEIFGDAVLWIPYVDPGFTLARTLSRSLQSFAARTGRERSVSLPPGAGWGCRGRRQRFLADVTDSPQFDTFRRLFYDAIQ